MLTITISTQILRAVLKKKLPDYLKRCLHVSCICCLSKAFHEYSCWRLVSLAVKCLIYCTIHIKCKYRILIWIDWNRYYDRTYTWWRHQLETFPTLLAFCEGDSLVTGYRWIPLTKASDAGLRFIYASTNGWAYHRDAADLRRHRADYEVTVMQKVNVSVVVDCASNVPHYYFMLPNVTRMSILQMVLILCWDFSTKIFIWHLILPVLRTWSYINRDCVGLNHACFIS